jgi:hypothetical protein
MSKKSFFSSWSYIILAFVLYYGLARVIFSFEYVEPVHVALDAAQCEVAGVPINAQYGSCISTGRLRTDITGEYVFLPSSRPGLEMPMSRMPTYYHEDGADHFPGGTLCLGVALLLPALVLLFPMVLGLITDIESIAQRLDVLRHTRR